MNITEKNNLVRELKEQLVETVVNLGWKRRNLIFMHGLDFPNTMTNYCMSGYNQGLLRADKLIGKLREAQEKSILS